MFIGTQTQHTTMVGSGYVGLVCSYNIQNAKQNTLKLPIFLSSFLHSIIIRLHT